MKLQALYILLVLGLTSCLTNKSSFVQVQKKDLYDISVAEDTTSVYGFKELIIFSDILDIRNKPNCAPGANIEPVARTWAAFRAGNN